MQSHWFYTGIFVVFLIALAFFVPQNTITGLSVGSCEGCGLSCENDNECGTGLSCCETAWDLGVCHQEGACLSIQDMSERITYEEYAQPETPRAIKNIAWQTFGVPLLVVIGTVVVAVLLGRKPEKKKKNKKE